MQGDAGVPKQMQGKDGWRWHGSLIPATHACRRRNARYQWAVAWLVAVYRPGKVWSSQASYWGSAYAKRRFNMHVGYQVSLTLLEG